MARPWPIVVRRARPSDRDAVLSFATHTWHGWDYIPEVWERWLTAEDGIALVATAGRGADGEGPRDADGEPLAPDTPIAFTRLARLSQDELWLEGIRVDPRVRGMGVATDLQVAELHWAAAHGGRVIRYVTGQDNEGSHKLGAKHGFRVVGRRRWYGADQDDDADPPAIDPTWQPDPLAARPLGGDDDMDAWWAALAEDATFAESRALYESRSWAFRELTRARFAERISAGAVVVAGSPSDAAWAMAIGRPGPEGEDAPDLPTPPALVAGEADLAVGLLRHLGGGRPGLPAVRLPDPDPAMLRDGAGERWAAAGWPPAPRATHLLECRLDSIALPPVDPAALVLEEQPAEIARPPD